MFKLRKCLVSLTLEFGMYIFNWQRGDCTSNKDPEVISFIQATLYNSSTIKKKRSIEVQHSSIVRWTLPQGAGAKFEFRTVVFQKQI